jgi:hypothetical protein
VAIQRFVVEEEVRLPVAVDVAAAAQPAAVVAAVHACIFAVQLAAAAAAPLAVPAAVVAAVQFAAPSLAAPLAAALAAAVEDRCWFAVAVSRTLRRGFRRVAVQLFVAVLEAAALAADNSAAAMAHSPSLRPSLLP